MTWSKKTIEDRLTVKKQRQKEAAKALIKITRREGLNEKTDKCMIKKDLIPMVAMCAHICRWDEKGFLRCPTIANIEVKEPNETFIWANWKYICYYAAEQKVYIIPKGIKGVRTGTLDEYIAYLSTLKHITYAFAEGINDRVIIINDNGGDCDFTVEIVIRRLPSGMDKALSH